MTDENFAERAAAAVRAVIQRELARIEERWNETFDRLSKALALEVEGVAARIPDRGEKGEQGPPGERGLDGKDALEIVIQPDLDPAKSYPRGTFVTHMGGLVRSCRKTTPLAEAEGLEGAGWVVIVRGIASAEVEYPSERTMRTVFTYTDGAKTVTEVRYPGPLDKGVFREGDVYERGDGVTFGGSWWIAQKDAPDGKPGLSADWRLAVKRGRDGKDAK